MTPSKCGVNFNATLLGEPTGEKPNGNSEVRTLTLPNSGLKIQYSAEFSG